MTITGLTKLKMSHLRLNLSHHGVTINMTIMLDVVQCLGFFQTAFREMDLFLLSGIHIPPLNCAPLKETESLVGAGAQQSSNLCT